MTRQLILSTRGSKKIHNAMGTPPCTFRQLWDNVALCVKDPEKSPAHEGEEEDQGAQGRLRGPSDYDTIEELDDGPGITLTQECPHPTTSQRQSPRNRATSSGSWRLRQRWSYRQNRLVRLRRTMARKNNQPTRLRRRTRMRGTPKERSWAPQTMTP